MVVKKIWIVGIAAALHCQLLAVDQRGNGGDVVVCYDKSRQISNIELLDFYEARTMRKIKLSLGNPQLSYMTKVKRRLQEIRPIFDLRADQYLQEIEAFEDNANFLSGITLVDINDSNHLALPKDCKIEQIVIQQPIEFPEDKKYVVNADLWDWLVAHERNNDLAGLLLHEAILTEALRNGHKSSLETRYFNSVLTSDRYKVMTDHSVSNLLELIGFEYYYKAGLTLWNSSYFYDNGALRLATLKDKAQIEVGANKYQLPYLNGVLFYESGEIKAVDGPGHKVLVGKQEIDINSYEQRIFFRKDQTIEKIKGALYHSLIQDRKGGWINFSNRCIALDEEEEFEDFLAVEECDLSST